MEPVRFLQIEPTTRCNFTCGFCAGRAMEQADLSYERFAAAVAALPDLQHVELQGEGESFMHPRFFDMLELLRGRGIRVSLITNGSFLSAAAVERLLDAGVERVSVSMESADAATFRQIRGGKLDKVVRGLEALMAARARRGQARPAVGLSITVLRRTFSHLPGIIALYRRLGLDGGITLQPLQRMAPYVKNYDAQMAAELLSPEQVDDLWIRFYADRDVKQIQKERSPIPGFFAELMAGWRPGRGTCPWLEQGLYVSRDGLCSACCMAKDPAHAFGRIGEDPLGDILAARQRLRDQLRAGTTPAPCAGCEMARFALMGRLDLLRFGLRGLYRRLTGARAER